MMPSALVYNNSVEAFYVGAIPNPLSLPDGTVVLAPSSGYVSAGGYSILPAVYTDTPPLPQSQSTGQNYSISGGTVQVTRTWITPPQSPISVQINSVSTPALNGPYSITPQSRQSYSAIALQLQAFGAFSGGAAALSINDANGIPHSFTVPSFLNFYNAVTYYANALSSGQTPPIPMTIT
jgi:hypothetical protein